MKFTSTKTVVVVIVMFFLLLFLVVVVVAAAVVAVVEHLTNITAPFGHPSEPSQKTSRLGH